ncbi:hypothetical protein GF351_02300 [Candidatus Woesearchaeota archaeon]|nr:hypothetical protein [Candidatus Woesearchaeota archaeon]
MKAYILAAIAAILLVSISGCEEGDQTQEVTPFIGGTTGLLLNLVENSPPESVYDEGNHPFDVTVKLKNDGEEFVAKEDCIVKISGIDPVEYGLTPADMVKNPEEDLNERKKDAEGNIIEGTVTWVNFPNFVYQGEVSGPTPYTIRADACYKYGTTVNSKLCIKENLLDVEDDDICKVEEEKQVFNSGGPVQVISLYEEPSAKDKIVFQFKIEHKGNGEVYQLGSECEHERTYEDKVWVEVVTELPGLSCQGLVDGTETTGYVTLYGGERTIRCVQQIISESDFEKVAKIYLTYLYEDDTSTQIVVKASD